MRQLYFRYLTVAALVAAIGCGSASNNDQSVSVLNLGFFAAGPQNATAGAAGGLALPAGFAGAEVQICSSRTEFSSTLTPGGTGELPSGAFVAWIGFLNNLSQVGVVVNRIELQFNIPGASIQPPTTSLPAAVVLGPFVAAPAGAGVANQPSFTSSLPPGFAGLSRNSYTQFDVIPAAIRSWMCLNRESLPLRPFQLEVTAFGRYRTTAGDFQTTGAETVFFNIIEETAILPTDATDGDAAGVTAPESSGVTLPAEGDSSDGTTGTVSDATGEL